MSHSNIELKRIAEHGPIVFTCEFADIRLRRDGDTLWVTYVPIIGQEMRYDKVVVHHFNLRRT